MPFSKIILNFFFQNLSNNPGSGFKFGQHSGSGSKFNVFGIGSKTLILFILFWIRFDKGDKINTDQYWYVLASGNTGVKGELPLEWKSVLLEDRESSSKQELHTLSGLEDWAGRETRLEEQPLHITSPHFLIKINKIPC